MICVNNPCDLCKNMLGIKEGGYRPCCKAYPDGIPESYYFDINPKELKECANGYKWEPREDE